jgi:TetR/AcrR family transcriptional regulator, ethionamide resistance regulator
MRVNLEARAAAAEQRRAKTRELLLSAAEAVVAERGFEAASVEEFVRAAGVSRGTFYNYFPTTTDLVAALNERVSAHLNGVLVELMTRRADPATLLAASLHRAMAAYLADPVRGWVALQLAGSRAPRVRSFEAHFGQLYAQGVREGQFRDVDVGAALTVTFGAMRMAQRDVVSGDVPPARVIQVVALILTAFGVPRADAERISHEEAQAARG